jgi:hypothetical protein
MYLRRPQLLEIQNQQLLVRTGNEEPNNLTIKKTVEIQPHYRRLFLSEGSEDRDS